MTDKQKQITFSDIIAATKECAAEKGVELPDTTTQILREHIKVSRISSYRELHETHQALKAALKECEIFEQIAFSVRLKLAILLGFSEFTETPDPLTGVSPQEFLTAFIQNLPEGETWTPKDLCRWDYKGMRGQTFFTRITKRIGQVSKEAIINIIGNQILAAALLRKNPLIIQITTVLQAKEYLTQFLGTLDDKEEWYAEDLRAWKSTQTPKGTSIWNWIRTKFKRFDEDIVKKVLDKDADRLLKRNPYRERDTKTIEEVKEYFVEFLGSLKEDEPWEIKNNLRKWKSKNGYTGCALENRLRKLSNSGDLDIETLKSFLGKDHEHLLTKHPLERQKRIHYSTEDAKKTMTEFLKSLKENKTWSPKTLQKWGNLGHSLYDWLRKHFRTKDNTPDWDTIIANFVPKEFLEKHPFRKTFASTHEVSEALKEFLDSLKKGQRWSPKRLALWGTKEDPSMGNRIYYWIRANIRYNGEVDWLWVLIKLVPIEYFRRNMFTHRYNEAIKDLEDRRVTQNRIDISDLNYGLGVRDQSQLDPEEEALLDEEVIGREINLIDLRLNIALLGQEDRSIIEAFMNEEDVDSAKLGQIIEKLQTAIGVERKTQSATGEIAA